MAKKNKAVEKAAKEYSELPDVNEVEVNDESAEMSKTSKQQKSFDGYLVALREKEAKSLKPRSGDYEVLEDVSEKDIRALQGFDEENPTLPPNPQNARLVGFQKFGKGNVCFVLKEAFIAKKESLKEDN